MAAAPPAPPPAAAAAAAGGGAKGPTSKNLEGRIEEQSTDKVVKILGSRAASKASNVLFGLTSKAWTLGEDIINSCAWSHDGKLLAVAGNGANTNDGDAALNPEHSLRIYQFDIETKKLTGITSAQYGESSSIISCLSWFKKGEELFLAVGGTIKETVQDAPRKELKIYRFNKTKKTLQEYATRSWSTNGGHITSVAWHPTQSYLAVGGSAPDTNDDETTIDKNDALRIYLFDPSKKETERLKGITSRPWSTNHHAIKSIAWNNKGNMLAIGGEAPNEPALRDINFQGNNEIRLYTFDPNSSDKLSSFASTGWPQKSTHWINTLTWSPDDRHLAVGGKCAENIVTVQKNNLLHEFRIYEISPEADLQKRITQIASKGWSTKGNQIFSISWHNKGNVIAIAGQDPDLKDEDVHIDTKNELRLYHFNPTNQDYQERLVGIASKRWSTKGFPINVLMWNPLENFLIVAGKRPDTNEKDKTAIKETAALRLYQLADIKPEDNTTAHETKKVLIGVTSKNWVTLGAVLKRTAWSNEGKYIAVGGKLANASDNNEIIKPNDKLRIYQFNGSTASPVTSKTWSITDNGINAIAWSPNDSYIAIGGEAADSDDDNPNIKKNENLRIYAFDPTKNQPKDILSGIVGTSLVPPNGIINDISWSPDGQFLIVVGSFPKATKPGEDPISAGDEIKVFSFNPSSATVNQRLVQVSTQTLNTPATAIAWAKDKKHIAIGSQKGLCIYKFDKKSLMRITQVDEAKTPTNITSISWAPDSLGLVVGGSSALEGNDLFIYSFDPSKNSLKPVAQKKWSTTEEAIESVSWNSDGEFIAVAGINKDVIESGDFMHMGLRALHVYYFDSTTNDLTDIDSRVWAHIGGKITSVCWSPNGEYLTVSGMNAHTIEKEANIGSHHELRLYRFKKSNTSFFTGTTSKCWSNTTDPINSISWNKDGKYLAVGGLRAAIKDKDESIDEKNPLRVYEFDDRNSSLQAIASAHFENTKGIESEITVVAWHPTDDMLAIAERKITEKNAVLSASVHIFKFDPKTKSLTLLASKAFGNYGNSIIKTLAWDPDGNNLAIGGKGSSTAEGRIIEKDVLRIYQVKVSDGKLEVMLGKNYGDSACIDSLAWVKDDGDIFLAIGGSSMEPESSDGLKGPVKKPDASEEKLSNLKVYKLTHNDLVEIWNREWSDEKSTINTLAWSPNKLFLAAGGGTSNVEEYGIPAKRAFQLYFFNSKKQTFTAVTSRQWSNYGGAIRTISWSPNNLFLAVGGGSANLSDKDKNINQNNEFRLYFFDSFNMEGLASRDWSSLGYPLKDAIWHPSGNFIVLAGQKTTTFDGTPSNHALQLYRFNAGTAIPHTLKDALQKASSSTTIVLARSNGEYWSLDHGSAYFFDGTHWEAARVDGSIKNPNLSFIVEGDKNSIFAIDDKGAAHKASTISTGPAIVIWKPLKPVGQKVNLTSLIGMGSILYGIGDDKHYYQYDDKKGWKKLPKIPDEIQELVKQQYTLINFVCTGNICRKRGVLEGFAL